MSSQKAEQNNEALVTHPCSTPKKRRLTDTSLIPTSSRSPSVSSPVYPSSLSSYSQSSPMRHPSSSPPLIGQPASATNNDQLMRLSSDPEDLSIHSNSSCSFTSTAPKTEVHLKDKPIDVIKTETNCSTSGQPSGKVQESNGGHVLTGSKVPTWTQTQLQEAIEAVITQRMRFTQVCDYRNQINSFQSYIQNLYNNIKHNIKRNLDFSVIM